MTAQPHRTKSTYRTRQGDAFSALCVSQPKALGTRAGPITNAILQLKRRSDRGEITVFVSDVHDREATRLRADRQQAQQEVLAIFPKAVFRPQEDFIRHFPECSVIQPERRLHSAAGSCPPARPPA